MLLRIFGVILVLAIGAFFFWAFGPDGSDDPHSSDRVTSALESKAVRIEKRLAKDPSDEKLQLAVMRAWSAAGSQRLSKIDTETQPIPAAVSEDYRASLTAWNRYLKQNGGEAGADIAELASGTYFSLVEIGSTDLDEVRANAAGAARAQKIVCKHRPNLLTLSNLALYEYFNDEFAAGDKAARAAEADVDGPVVKYVKQQLGEIRERGERFLTKVKRAAAALGKSSEKELETPLKGFANSAGINRNEE